MMHKTKPIQALSAEFFLNMLRLGACRVIEKETVLNQLNIFPVNDSDTGLNLASLMRFILTQPYTTTNITTLLKQVSDAALIGACGNSGMIMSAFFTGFSINEWPDSRPALTANEFILRLRLAVKHAYQSVSEPVEGTILTTMSAWLAAWEEWVTQSDDFHVLFQKTLPAIEQALRQTEYQLAMLKEKGVVDAGAMGFVEFVQGMYDYLSLQNIEKYKVYATHFNSISIDTHPTHMIEEPHYTYCAETLISGAIKDTAMLKNALAEISDSLVINQNQQYLKVHLHTHDLLTMSKLMKKIGAIKYQKIDSMRMQWEVTNKRKYPIALVTDSSADLPEEWIANEQIHILPLQIRLGEDTFLDKLTLSLGDLYKEIHENNVFANTATPSADFVIRYLNFLSSHYDSIIIISLSSGLSSTYQMTANAAKKITNKRITVIDSLRNSAAQGMLVMQAARWISQGDDHDKIVANIIAIRNHTRIFVAVDEFKTMAKLGRRPYLMGMMSFVANWSHFKPIISLNATGGAMFAGFAIGKKQCWNKIIKLIKKIQASSKINSVGVVHAAALEKAQEFAAYIEQQTHMKIDFITETSCSIGLHAGCGSIAVAISSEVDG